MNWLLSKIDDLLIESLPAPGMVPKEEKQARSWNYTDPFGTLGLVSGYSSYLQTHQELVLRYQDYEAMAEYPELETSLGIYADDATKVDLGKRHRVWVETTDKTIQTELENLLYERLHIDDELRNIAYRTGMYGNDFCEVGYDDTEGVVKMFPVVVPTMRRIEDLKGTLIGFAQELSGASGSAIDPKVFMKTLEDLRKGKLKADRPRPFEPFEPWEVIHWRLRNHKVGPYGYSLFEPARWAFRRLVLLEDAALVFKLTRAPARYAFYIDVTGKPNNEIQAYLHRAKQNFQKKKFVTSDGKLDFRASPLAMDESFFISTSKGQDSARIETLTGADWQAVEDLEYFRQKLLAAMKMPASYMGTTDGDTSRSLAQQDVRFASSVERIQGIVLQGLTQMCRYHMMVKGLDPDQTKWTLRATPVSAINALAQVEERASKADLASRLTEIFPMEMILQQVFGHSEEEAAKIIKAMDAQKMRLGKLDAKIQTDAQVMMQDALPEEPMESVQQILGKPKDALDAEVAKQISKEIRESANLRKKATASDSEAIKKELLEMRKELRRLKLLAVSNRQSQTPFTKSKFGGSNE